MEHRYTATDFVRSLTADEYITRFRDAEKFIAFCRQCPNFGNSWGCPPFSHDCEAHLRQFRNVMLIATKIVPAEQGLPLSESRTLILPERKRLERSLLALEKEYGGRSFAYVGSCLHCPEKSCTRPEGKPCRHPELVRPSLEAYGFDIGRTASELFDIELKWSADGMMPEYLTLVCGFFHNSSVAPVW